MEKLNREMTYVYRNIICSILVCLQSIAAHQAKYNNATVCLVNNKTLFVPLQQHTRLKWYDNTTA